MSKEMKYPDMTQEDLSYELRNERKAAEGELYTLRKERDARHEEEKKQLAVAKCFLKRWAIHCRANRQDWRDDEREEELLEIANPMAAMMHYKEKHCK